jgi:putative membrane protein
MSSPEFSPEWKRLHPVTPLLRSFQLLYAFVLGALTARFGGPVILVLLLSLTAVAAWITVGYLRYRYTVAQDSLVIHHGVLFRQRRVIPRSRIQNVDLRAGLIQQLFGVVTARVETAGGGRTEAVLHVLGRSEGALLRDTLVALPWTKEATPAVPYGAPPDLGASLTGGMLEATRPETTAHHTPPLDLVIAGATSNRAGLLMAALLGGDYFLEIVPTDWLLRRFLPPELLTPETAANTLVQAAQQDLRAFLIGAIVLTIFFGIAGWGLSIMTSVVRFFDFTLSLTGGEIRVGYGLFTRREKSFRRSRVQNVQIEESILRRWFDLASLRVQTAGYGPGAKADERVETLTPIARGDEIAAYLRTVFPDMDWGRVEWRPSHPRARRRLFIRRALTVVLASLIFIMLLDYRALLLLFGLVPAWLLAAAHYRHLGHARVGEYVLVREGFWNRRTYVVPIRKIQALHLRQTPFQRRLGLGTVVLETAGNPFDWHSPRSLDVGETYGMHWIDSLATDVTKTGLVF